MDKQTKGKSTQIVQTVIFALVAVMIANLLIWNETDTFGEKLLVNGLAFAAMVVTIWLKFFVFWKD